MLKVCKNAMSNLRLASFALMYDVMMMMMMDDG